MVTGLFTAGRLAGAAMASRPTDAADPAACARATPEAVVAGRLSFARFVRRGLARPTDDALSVGLSAGLAAGLAAGVASRLTPARAGHTSAALSAASDAERLKRLRASFEDDLAHFLRSGATVSSD